jgi:hypothetical protein
MSDSDVILYRLRHWCSIGSPSDHDTMNDAANFIEKQGLEILRLKAAAKRRAKAKRKK